ncbi:MAG: patatin-like phospholipase family protein, partial [Acidimicrobiia bacterium]
MSRALVLGGGGVAGIAWEIGVLDALARAGVDLTAADRIVGTSAGAAVGAQL